MIQVVESEGHGLRTHPSCSGINELIPIHNKKDGSMIMDMMRRADSLTQWLHHDKT